MNSGFKRKNRPGTDHVLVLSIYFRYLRVQGEFSDARSLSSHDKGQAALKFIAQIELSVGFQWDGSA